MLKGSQNPMSEYVLEGKIEYVLEGTKPQPVKPGKKEEEEKFENAHFYIFDDLLLAIENSPLIKKYNIMKGICLIIGKMAIVGYPIDINPKTMIINITKGEYSAFYGLKNLFLQNGQTYCSASQSGNCVDILLDLQSEYTFTAFEAWASGYGFTCPLSKAYLWVFKESVFAADDSNNNNVQSTNDNKYQTRSVSEIKEIAQEFYAKEKYDQLKTDYSLVSIDSEKNERTRNESMPVSFVEGKEKNWRKTAKIGEYMKGRYILIKLIASGVDNMDAKFVGVEGYKMKRNGTKFSKK